MYLMRLPERLKQAVVDAGGTHYVAQMTGIIDTSQLLTVMKTDKRAIFTAAKRE
jgi:hypothetical protein